MRVPLQWLADYVDLDLDVDDLAHRLTMSGLKVEAVERIGEGWQDVVIGRVSSLEPHPASRKPMNVASVDLGSRTVTIVTAAQNVRAGDIVAVVPVGGLLPHGPDGAPMVIQRKPMAGIDSEGMMASERELGISDEHSGIMILPEDAPVGAPLRSFLGDDVLDIETNPNRPDTLSIIGIAREVAALTEQQLSLPDLDAAGPNIEWVDEPGCVVRVEDPDLCPRYTALRIDGVEVGESPAWLRGRLEAAGMRAINLLVDITNYVMLEYGQPMHAFDQRDLADGEIVVRRARLDEVLRTLDGVERTLTPDTLIIADAERPVAVAGVMGGENSEIRSDTSALVLESATFDGSSVRRTAQHLGLRTEASSRFEKSLPPEQTLMGARRFLQLLAQITGRPLRAYRPADVWVGAPPRREVTMPWRDLGRLLGIQVARDRAVDVLSLLGFEVAAEDAGLTAAVPFWRRVDIEQSADLVEEVARIVGFEAVSATLPRRTMPPPAPLAALYWDGVLRDRLLAAGASEITTHGLTSPDTLERLLAATPVEDPTWSEVVLNPAGIYAQQACAEPVQLMNPATRDRQMLRVSLLPGMLDVVLRNLKVTEECVAFFEIGTTVFRRPGDALPYERRTLGVALSGRRVPASWQDAEPPPYSFFDVKGIVEAVLAALHVADCGVERSTHPALHPGRAATIRREGRDVALFGQLHPRVASAFDIETWPVQVAEFDLDELYAAATPPHNFVPLPRYPPARRDLAVVVGRDVPAGDVLRVVRGAAGEVLEDARIFDVYAGQPLPLGVKSVALSLEFRAPGATLTQEEVSEVMEQIVARLGGELGATIRE